MRETSPLRLAIEQVRSINTSPKRALMAEERDLLETRKASLSLDISNLNSEIDSYRALRDEIEKAIKTKISLRDEALATFESATQTQANLDIQLKRMEAKS